MATGTIKAVSGASTLRDIPFGIAVSDWSSVTGGFKATVLSSYVTSTCKWEVLMSINYARLY